MYSGYRDMNSYPYQTPFSPFNFPSWEAFRPQMKEDGAKTHPMPEYWPSNCSYQVPMPCQNCCAHGQQPSHYNFRPPYPHCPLPPSCGHYYGGYPATYPQPYPYPHVPPPHYSMEMPRYEFDKGSPKAIHCCECPNHPSHVRSTSNVKIEEQDPDVETKKATSLIPAESSSSPHPPMWASPGYLMNTEQPRRVVEGGNLVEPQVCSNVEKPKKGIEPVEQDPYVKYQWFPLDMNSIKRLMEAGELMKPEEKKYGDEKKSSDVEKKDQNKQFSYPIIWMPYGGQGEDQTRGQEKNIGKSPAVDAEERNKAKLPVEECPTFKLLKHPDKELLKERTESGDDPNGAGIRGSRKTGIVKTIPVKQLDDAVPMPLKKEQESELNKGVKNVESVKNGTEMKPSSPTRKSKLPPICLRVDPPRKKNGKGSSRSPSPLGEKRHQASSCSKEERKDKEVIQVKELVGNDPKENVVVPNAAKEEKGSCTREHQSEAEEEVVHTSDSSKFNATVSEDNAVHAQESQGVKESEHKESDVPERKVLSEMEAAVVLQSVYRGYAVRRWEPLTKLRRIANVKEEARKVSERVEKLESCVNLDDKEKVAIGEMIMNLLLKLDTIQGLHPSVRDVRKSVTKELIRLQEKLDSIVSQVSIPTAPRSSAVPGVEQEHNASNLDDQSAGSLEIASEASKTFELGEKEGEEASISEVPLSRSLESQDTNQEELGRESQNEQVVSPIGSFSEYDVPGSFLEKKERELDEIITPAEGPSMEFQVDPSTDFKDTPGQFRDKDQEGNLDAEAPDENVENDIQRMEWECNLGTVKTDRELDRGGAEISKEMEEQIADIAGPLENCNEDVASALEMEKVAEKHVEVTVENDIEIDSGNCYKEQEDDQHQPIGKSQVQGDHFEAIHHGNHLTGQTCGERNPGAQEFETTDGVKYMSLVENLMGGKAPFLEPVIEVENHVLEGRQATEPSVSEDTPSQPDVGICCKDEDKNLNETPQRVEEVEDDICRMEWECDIGAAKFTPGIDQEETQLPESYEGLEKQASVVDKSETEPQVDQLSGKSQVQYDDCNAENHVSAESCDKKNTDTRERDNAIGNMDKDAQESEIPRCNMEVPIVEQGQPVLSLEPVIEVEKQMITELPVSEGGKEECSLDLSTSPTTVQQYEEQINRDKNNRRIIEENEKLRSMVEQLLASGKEQQNVISTLTTKINALEKKLPKRKSKMRLGKRPRVILTRNAS